MNNAQLEANIARLVWIAYNQPFDNPLCLVWHNEQTTQEELIEAMKEADRRGVCRAARIRAMNECELVGATSPQRHPISGVVMVKLIRHRKGSVDGEPYDMTYEVPLRSYMTILDADPAEADRTAKVIEELEELMASKWAVPSPKAYSVTPTTPFRGMVRLKYPIPMDVLAPLPQGSFPYGKP